MLVTRDESRGADLESVKRGNPLVGSNPTATAHRGPRRVSRGPGRTLLNVDAQRPVSGQRDDRWAPVARALKGRDCASWTGFVNALRPRNKRVAL